MNATLFLSIFTAEGEPPHPFDPFPGAVQPFAAVVLVVLVVFLVWWLLRLQVAQVEPVQVGHGHGDEHGHGNVTHAAVGAMGSGTTAPPAEKDDLNQVEGIGPKVTAALNKAGIHSFSQLASADAAQLRSILDAAGYAYMDPASWPEQARLAAAGDWEGLQKLQGDLDAGRSA